MRVLEPCKAVMDCGLLRSEVWLGEHVIDLLGLKKLKRSSDIKTQLCGRALKGVALRCRSACAIDDDRNLSLWATEACFVGA